MPILNLKLSGNKSAERNQAVVSMLLGHTQQILGKKPEVTAITIQHIAPEDWFIAGRSLVEWGKSSFYLDIKVTDETNTKMEKAQYIAAVFASMQELLGAIHEESYIYVEDVRAAAYGYGGHTQEYRYQHIT